jgi:hypothetical protein
MSFSWLTHWKAKYGVRSGGTRIPARITHRAFDQRRPFLTRPAPSSDRAPIHHLIHVIHEGPEDRIAVTILRDRFKKPRFIGYRSKHQ